MTYASEQDTDELIRIGKMPTALALAEQLEKTMQSPLHGKAADELRRLYALCEEMHSKLFAYRARDHLKDATASLKAKQEA